MTESEAKAILEDGVKIKEKLPNLAPVYEVAIKALEKQIPMKPREGRFGLMGCPLCLEKVGQRVTKTLYEDLFQYCPTCGQKISWDSEV